MKARFSKLEERKKISIRIIERYNDNPSLRENASLSSIKRYADVKEREKTSIATKKALKNVMVREKISAAGTKRYSNIDERRKDSERTKKIFLDSNFRNKHRNAIKTAMRDPDIRKKHIAALLETNYIGRKTDKGQLELLKKWNQMGFKFKPNYPVFTNAELFYIDGYDEEHNVVIEYDSKYHNRMGQRTRDLIRQNKIISILHPKKFWRYNAVNKQWNNVMGDN